MAVTKRPYILTDSVSISANGSGQAQLRPGANERFEGHKLWFTKTSTFNITGITNDSGLPFTNADTDDPIPSTAMPTTITDFNNPIIFNAPLVIEKNDALIVSLTDTSGASNVVRVFMLGTMESLTT